MSSSESSDKTPGKWSPEFTPGQLAMITIAGQSGHDPGPHRAAWSRGTRGWHYTDRHDTFRFVGDRYVVQALPLVVLDPASESDRSALRGSLQYMGYELNDQQQDLEPVLLKLAGEQPRRVPPKPEEPVNYLAVVETRDGKRYWRWAAGVAHTGVPWRRLHAVHVDTWDDDESHYRYDELGVATVVSEGVSPQ